MSYTQAGDAPLFLVKVNINMLSQKIVHEVLWDKFILCIFFNQNWKNKAFTGGPVV